METIDAGANWNVVSNDGTWTSQQLHSLHCPNSGTAYVVGKSGFLRKWSDGTVEKYSR